MKRNLAWSHTSTLVQSLYLGWWYLYFVYKMPIWKYLDTCYKYGCIFLWITLWMMVCWTAKTMFYGPLESCPLCDGNLYCIGVEYTCKSCNDEWSTCTYSTRNPQRKEQSLKLPEGIRSSVISDVRIIPSSYRIFELISLFIVYVV